MGIRIETDGSSRVEMRMPGKAIPEAERRRGALGKLDAMALSEFRKLSPLKRERLISDARLAQLLTYRTTQYVGTWIELSGIRGGDKEKTAWEKLTSENMIDITGDQVWIASNHTFWHHDVSKKSKAILAEIDALIDRCRLYIKEGAPSYAQAIKLLMRINRKIMEKNSLDTRQYLWTNGQSRHSSMSSSSEHRNQI